jgi:Cu/Ag efflux protein CusF
MGKWLLVGALALGGTGVTFSAFGEDARSTQQSEADAVTARARIQKIDKNSRTVTLNDMKGRTLDVQVGPSVDLNALHLGDLVQATYYESVAVNIRSPGERTTGQTNQQPGSTEKTVERPGASVRQTTVNARVTSVDLKSDTVTLDMPQGGMRTVHVKDPAVKARLGNLKPGSMVDITYTQAAAISVQPTR